MKMFVITDSGDFIFIDGTRQTSRIITNVPYPQAFNCSKVLVDIFLESSLLVEEW